MKLNWNFQGHGRVQTKKQSLGEVWILLEPDNQILQLSSLIFLQEQHLDLNHRQDNIVG